MSSRAKLLVSVLFIAVILLCIGLTRFYFDVTKNTGENGQSDKIADIVRDYGDKRVFRSTTGYCGVINDAGAVLIEPEENYCRMIRRRLENDTPLFDFAEGANNG